LTCPDISTGKRGDNVQIKEDTREKQESEFEMSFVLHGMLRASAKQYITRKEHHFLWK
jgi:hypothetical protein